MATQEADSKGKDSNEAQSSLLSSLTPEERELLELHQSSRPARGWENKKQVKKKQRKKRRKGLIGLFTRPETYAVFFAIMPAFILGIAVAGVIALETTMDISVVEELIATNDDAASGVAEETGLNLGYVETMLWVHENIVLVVLVLSTLFFGIAALIMLIAKMIRLKRDRKEAGDE